MVSATWAMSLRVLYYEPLRKYNVEHSPTSPSPTFITEDKSLKIIVATTNASILHASSMKVEMGAGGGDRTHDLSFMSAML